MVLRACRVKGALAEDVAHWHLLLPVWPEEPRKPRSTKTPLPSFSQSHKSFKYLHTTSKWPGISFSPSIKKIDTLNFETLSKAPLHASKITSLIKITILLIFCHLPIILTIFHSTSSLFHSSWHIY